MLYRVCEECVHVCDNIMIMINGEHMNIIVRLCGSNVSRRALNTSFLVVMHAKACQPGDWTEIVRFVC